MRQRCVKNKAQILLECAEYNITNPEELKGKWKDRFDNGKEDIFLEIGSGKGQFLLGMATSFADKNFIACEGGENINVRILQKVQQNQPGNMLVITKYIEKASDMFAEGELSGIYLNFSDPWPKDRHQHRRLTYRDRLEEYKKVIKPGGFLAFKTDNDELFEWSLSEFEFCGLNPSIICRDLWNSEYKEANIPTEYEEKFASQGKTINYVLVNF